MHQTDWADWIGRTETRVDTLSPTPLQALEATFGRSPPDLPPGTPCPALWSWLYFLPLAPMGEIGEDGHPRRGGFLPPIDLPRRMWAGSRCTIHGPLGVGDAIRRTSTLQQITGKSGSAGPLVFVTVRHEVSTADHLVMVEEQDIVFMQIPAVWQPPAPTPLPVCAWSEPVRADPVFLFRISALTFNGHRIHYDRTYATEVEHYPGLVVHGPAQALLMFDAAQRRHPERRPGRFSFRGVRPLFDFDTIGVHGAPRPDGGLDLFTANGDGAVGMQATLSWADD